MVLAAVPRGEPAVPRTGSVVDRANFAARGGKSDSSSAVDLLLFPSTLSNLAPSLTRCSLNDTLLVNPASVTAMHPRQLLQAPALHP